MSNRTTDLNRTRKTYSFFRSRSRVVTQTSNDTSSMSNFASSWSPVIAATSSTLPTYTSASNKTLTATGTGTLTIDGVSVTTNDRVLVKNANNAVDNGVYTVVSPGGSLTQWTLTRASDAVSSDLHSAGMTVYVQQGTINRGAYFQLHVTGAVTLGTTSLKFLRINAAVDARVFAAADNSTDDLASLQLAHSSTDAVVYTSGTYKLSSNGTLGGTGKTLIFDRGAMLHVVSGTTITINARFEAEDDQQIFQIDDGGTVTPGSFAPRTVRPEYWGALADGATDDKQAIQRAIDWTRVADGGIVRFRAKQYAISGTLEVGSASLPCMGITLEGERQVNNVNDASFLFLGPASGTMMRVRNAHAGRLRNVGFNAANKANYGLQFQHAPGDANVVEHWDVESCFFSDAKLANVLIGEPDSTSSLGGDESMIRFVNCYFVRSFTGATTQYHVRQRSANALGNSVEGCQFDGNGTYPSYGLAVQAGGFTGFGNIAIGTGQYDILLDTDNVSVPGYVWIDGWESQSRQFAEINTFSASAATQRDIKFANVYQADVGSGLPGVKAMRINSSGYGVIHLDACRFVLPVDIESSAARVRSEGTNFGGGTGGEFTTHPELVTGYWINNANNIKKQESVLQVQNNLVVTGSVYVTGSVNVGTLKSTGSILTVGTNTTNLFDFENANSVYAGLTAKSNVRGFKLDASNCTDWGLVQLTAKGADATGGVYADGYALYVRTTAGALHTTIKDGTATNNSTIVGANTMILGSSANTKIQCNNITGFQVDSSGNWIFGDGTAVATGSYTVSNHSLDRTLNESADTVSQVANVLGSLIADLSLKKIISASFI